MTQFHWQAHMPPACLSDAVCFGYWALPFLLYILFFPFILVQAISCICPKILFSELARLSRKVYSRLYVLECWQCFASWGFTLLYSWRRHRRVDILLPPRECSWLRCCEGAFLHQGQNSVNIYFRCLLWYSRSFGAAVLTSAFLLFKHVPNC